MRTADYVRSRCLCDIPSAISSVVCVIGVVAEIIVVNDIAVQQIQTNTYFSIVRDDIVSNGIVSAIYAETFPVARYIIIRNVALISSIKTDSRSISPFGRSSYGESTNIHIRCSQHEENIIRWKQCSYRNNTRALAD